MKIKKIVSLTPLFLLLLVMVTTVRVMAADADCHDCLTRQLDGTESKTQCIDVKIVQDDDGTPPDGYDFVKVGQQVALDNNILRQCCVEDPMKKSCIKQGVGICDKPGTEKCIGGFRHGLDCEQDDESPVDGCPDIASVQTATDCTDDASVCDTEATAGELWRCGIIRNTDLQIPNSAERGTLAAIRSVTCGNVYYVAGFEAPAAGANGITRSPCKNPIGDTGAWINTSSATPTTLAHEMGHLKGCLLDQSRGICVGGPDNGELCEENNDCGVDEGGGGVCDTCNLMYRAGDTDKLCLSNAPFVPKVGTCVVGTCVVGTCDIGNTDKCIGGTRNGLDCTMDDESTVNGCPDMCDGGSRKGLVCTQDDESTVNGCPDQYDNSECEVLRDGGVETGNGKNTLMGDGGNACPPYTVIELVSFTATEVSGDVVLDWVTASEIDNAGFYIWRKEGGDGEYVQISGTIIPAEGSPTQGATYAYTDDTVVGGTTYYYRLEDIDINGTSTFHDTTGIKSLLVGSTDTSAGAASGKKCFIATAAFGSYLDPHVDILRQFRDGYLLTNGPGRAFVDTYYTYSPPLADFIAEHALLRAITRVLLLPIVGLGAFMVKTTLMVKMFSLGLLMITISLLAIKRRRRVKG